MEERDLTELKNRYGVVGNDPALLRALRVAVTVAPADDLPVLVIGESGVGKDVIPKIIHQNSPRKGKKYLAVNCGAIAEGTVDSELFGHEKGAFTSAIETRKGFFEVADGGTLFLDEIGELPLPTQAKLLRVLQNGEFIRVGSSVVQTTNVRVIAATNKNLRHLVSTGKFREDLYYRINTIQIDMPALRDRKDDIHLLFRKFVSDFTDRYSRTNIRLTDDAVALLTSYRWPGNIRQLRSVAESVALMESQKMLPGRERVEVDAVTLAQYLPVEEKNTMPVLSGADNSFSSDEREILIKMILSLKQDVDQLKEVVYGTAGAPVRQPALLPDDSRDTNPFDEQESEPDEQIAQDPHKAFSLMESKDEMIRQALLKYPTKKEAADALNISERSLYRWLKKHE